MIKPFISTSTKINSFTLFYMFPHMQTSQFITVNYETTPVKKKKKPTILDISTVTKSALYVIKADTRQIWFRLVLRGKLVAHEAICILSC